MEAVTIPDRRYPRRLEIIGGGQLARMMALAALPLGCEGIILEKNQFSSAAPFSPRSMVGDWNDPVTLLQISGQCDVVTLENEFVAASALAILDNAGHNEANPMPGTVRLSQRGGR